MKPYIITLPESIGKGGKLSHMETGAIPFEVKRFYWIYGLDSDIERGGHSHLNSDRILLCLKGRVIVILENPMGESYEFVLNEPHKALFFPRDHWINMQCSAESILLTLASCSFEDDLYQRDYSVFKES